MALKFSSFTVITLLIFCLVEVKIMSVALLCLKEKRHICILSVSNLKENLYVFTWLHKLSRDYALRITSGNFCFEESLFNKFLRMDDLSSISLLLVVW